MQIGCYRHPVDYWIEHFRAIRRKESYTTKQVEEYGILLACVKSWIELMKPKGENYEHRQH